MLKTICFAAGLLAMTTPAFAADPSLEAPLKSVTTAGVDFQNAAQVRAFYSKLKSAANAVCDSYSANSRVTQADMACANRALREAVTSANRPMLTAMLRDDGAVRLAANR